MRFDERAFIARPAAEVYALYRDRFGEIAVDLVNIRSVSFKERRPVDGGVYVRHRWTAQIGIPKVARPHVRPDMLAWEADVHWCDAERACTFDLTPDYFSEFGSCRGSVSVVPVPGGSEVRMHGELRVDLQDFRLLPRRLRKPLSRAAAKFMVARAPANFAAVARAVERFDPSMGEAPAGAWVTG